MSVESIERSPSISALEADFQRGNPQQFFGELALFLWPEETHKADFELHLRTGASDRQCRNWIAGSHPPSGRAIASVFAEISRRLS